MKKDSHERWSVVAGATGSLGGAITSMLIDQGHRVLAIARDRAKLNTLVAANPSVLACQADLALNDARNAISEAIVANGLEGPAAAVVQAIGLPIRPKNQPFDPDSMGIAVNVKCGGLMRLTGALDEHLGRGSRLVALGGYHGFEPDPTATNPGATNAALANLVHQLAAIYGKRGVGVFLVSPGPVDTDRIRKLADDASRIRKVDAAAVLDEWRNEATSGKLINLDQVAWTVRLLLDAEADAFHGSVLHIDGGRRKGIV